MPVSSLPSYSETETRSQSPMPTIVQMHKTALATLLGLSLCFLYSGCHMEKQSPLKFPQFTELSKEDAGRLDKQSALVAATAKERYGTSVLTRTKEDLAVLQRLTDDQVFRKNQTYELQCLGVVFGDVLAREYPLRWVMVTDEYGTDPTLRYKDMTLQINALTMISKRVERGDQINLLQLVQITGKQLAHFDKEWHK